jgi:CBS domain-containing protein
MSRRAAARLQRMRFRHVFAYAPGKVDWMAHGLPVERGPDIPPVIGDFVICDVPRCHPDDLIGAARDAAYEMGVDMCPVVDEENILLGLCTRTSLHAHPSIAVHLVMEPGPLTVRPSVSVEEGLKKLERKKNPFLLVTTPEGRLIGYFNRRLAAAGNGTGRST